MQNDKKTVVQEQKEYLVKEALKINCVIIYYKKFMNFRLLLVFVLQ